VTLTELAHPEWLGSAAAVVAAGCGALAFAHWRARRRLRRLLGPAARAWPAGGRTDLALAVALAAVAVALLGPRIGERVVVAPGSGVDVALLLDASRSMDATDTPPSRLDRARRAARELLARLGPEDRVALAAFAGRGVLVTPLTPDHAAVSEMLGAVDSDLIRPGASRLGDGVRAALEAFEPVSERPRVLVVLSDGEGRGDVGGRPAARANARAVAVALGSEAGAEIPDQGAPLRDDRGRVVVTRRDAKRLRELAEATGGRVLRADAWGAVDPGALAAAVRRDAGTRGERVERRVSAVRVWPFAALAFGLLLADALAGPARGRRSAGAAPPVRAARAQTARRAAAGAALALPLLGATDAPDADLRAHEAAVAQRPHDAEARVRLGVARLERDRPDAAARAFLAAALGARDPELAALAYYDLGVTHIRAGDLAAAREAFFDAVALAPDDERARFNLEWTSKALQEPPPPPAPRPEPREEPPEPEAEPEKPRPEPEPREPRPQEAADARDDAWDPRPMGPRERQRWMSLVEDDPARGLRARPGDERAPRRRPGPHW